LAGFGKRVGPIAFHRTWLLLGTHHNMMSEQSPNFVWYGIFKCKVAYKYLHKQ